MKVDIPTLQPLEEERLEAAISCGDELYFDNLIVTMAGFAAKTGHDPDSDYVYGMAKRIIEVGLRDHPQYKKRLQELLAARAKEIEFQRSKAAKDAKKAELHAQKIEAAEKRVALARESATLAQTNFEGAKPDEEKEADKALKDATLELKLAEEELAKLTGEPPAE